MLGVTLEHLHAHSTNDDWEETFLKGSHQFVHKLVSLKNVAMYWNPRGDFLDYTSQQEMGEAMLRLVSWVIGRELFFILMKNAWQRSGMISKNHLPL